MACIVVIDDDRLILELLRRGLKKAGHEVSVALSADEGLAAIRSSKAEIVLLDLEMPGKDGVACLTAIRADPLTAKIPVLMISGTPARQVVMRVAHIGVQGILIKNEKLIEELTARVARLAPSPPAPAPSPSRSPAISPTDSVPAAAVATTATAARLSTPSAPVAPAAAPNTCTEAEDAESLATSLLHLDGEPMDMERATAELKALKPFMARADLMERVIGGNDLKAMGPSVRSVLQLTGNASSSIDAIAKAIKQDQALSLKVLRVANSPLYARNERVENVQKAVARIGVSEIRNTVMGLAVIDKFSNTSLAGRIKAEWFWEHSLATGLIASKIARLRGAKTEESDAMFTAGLLHDVGRVIYAEQLGDTYTAVIDTADRLELPLETVESRLLIVNHADLTDKLLRQWNFSPELINPIALHHLSVGNIRRTAPRMLDQIATLALANRLAHALLLGCSGNEVVYPIEEFVLALSLSAEQVRDLCATVPEQVLDLKITMLSHGGGETGSLLDKTRAQLSPTPGDAAAGAAALRPIYVAREPDLDAAAILCRRLAAPSALEAPNIAIVRINHARERAEMLSCLRETETRHGLKDLPTLVVATGAGCFLVPEAVGPRRMVQAVVPLRLSRLVRGLRELIMPEALAAAA